MIRYFFIFLIFFNYAHASDVLNITFLGTGTPRPNIEKLGPSLLIKHKNYESLIDVGRGTTLRLNQIGNDFSKINSQIYIVCVGTNITRKNLPNNENLKKIFKSIAKKISKGDLIIMRGTLQVGVSRNLLVKILERFSKLKCGKDFYFSYMPERIIEGEALDELMQIPQIISGYSEACFERANEFANKCFNRFIFQAIISIF